MRLVVVLRTVLGLQIVQVLVAALVLLHVDVFCFVHLQSASLGHHSARSMHVFKLVPLLSDVILERTGRAKFFLLVEFFILPLLLQPREVHLLFVDGFVVLLGSCLLKRQVVFLLPLAILVESLLNKHLIGRHVCLLSPLLNAAYPLHQRILLLSLGRGNHIFIIN